jgi:hypothetical protein
LHQWRALSAGWTGKVLCPDVGLGSTLELSTPCVVDGRMGKPIDLGKPFD